jgi:hypothetical protein
LAAAAALTSGRIRAADAPLSQLRRPRLHLTVASRGRRGSDQLARRAAAGRGRQGAPGALPDARRGVAHRAAAVAGRGLFYQEGRAFAVAGGKLHEFFADFTTIERGDVAQDSNPGTMTTNGDGGGQLQITSGNVVYNFDLAPTC